MISEVTRRNIFDMLRLEQVKWSGRLNEPDFLVRVFDLEKMPSYDGRFKNAYGDIWQHRISNPTDWDEDWIYGDKRFNLLKCEDETFLNFLCEMIHPVVRSDLQETEQLRQWFNDYLAADGYEIIERSNISGRPIYAGRRKVEGVLSVSLARKETMFNGEYLSRQVNRIETAINQDPDLAIGTSKELVETCCKTILQELGAEFEDKWELTKLVKETCRKLKLTPDDIPDSAKASDTIKRLLSNLASVAQGLSELRNSYGTGHGKSAQEKGLTARHAKLAAGAATTLVVFLFETHESNEK